MESTIRVFTLWARQELLLAVRSRFLAIFAAVFAVLALLVASSGYVLTGGSGTQDFARTASSLVELVLLVVPLAALVIGTSALAPDRGTSELVYSQPVDRRTILCGRVTGLFLALVAAEAVGFGASGMVLFARAGSGGVGRFAGVMASAAILTAIFLALAAAITAGGPASRRARHLAAAVIVWFGAVVLYDVAVLGLASWLPSSTASRLLIVSAIVNPVDAVRTGSLLALEGTTAFGAASLAFLRFTGGSLTAGLWLGASALLWIVLPVIVGAERLRRADV